MARPEYTRCDNELVDPSAPSVQCERPRGHAGYHRKRMGVATIEWFNPDSMPERSVVADIPTYARDGRVSISGHDVSSVVSGVTVEADVNDITVITLRLMPGSLDIDAEGKGKITAGAHQLLTLLGWTPPDSADRAALDATEREIAAEWSRLDEWRLGIERVVCLDPSCPCDPDETSILVDDVTELSAADIRQMISNHRNAQTEPS